MRCPICNTDPCEVFPGHVIENAAWLLSEEAEETLNSGQWCSLFEHLSASLVEPETSSMRLDIHRQKVSKTATEQPPSSSQLPSRETVSYWIYALNPYSTWSEEDSDRGGKWLVFVPVAQVDAAWATIKKAVEEGQLGPRAKVATAKPSPLELSSKERVICVYTADWTDEYEVRRVHAVLYDLGFRRWMSYKTNQATRLGVYKHRGYARVSTYRLGPKDAVDFKKGDFERLRRLSPDVISSHQVEGDKGKL